MFTVFAAVVFICCDKEYNNDTKDEVIFFKFEQKLIDIFIRNAQFSGIFENTFRSDLKLIIFSIIS